MTLQPLQTVNAPATLTDEQRQRVSDALENAQSVNTRRNYAGQLRQFQSWCHQENYSALPAQSEVVAAYVAELADEGKSMSTIRLAVAAIVDAHRRVGLESPQTAGVTETLRGLSRQVGVSQKQTRPLDADALAAIRATALNPRKSRGGSLEMEETALRRGRHDIALASVLSDAGLRISEAADLRWRDVLDAEDGAGLVYIERSKTDQAGEGAYVVITPDTLTALKLLREDTGAQSDSESVFGISMSQDKSPRGQHGSSRGTGRGILGSLWARGPGYQDDPAWGAPAGGADSRPLEVAVNAREVHQK